MQSEQQRRISGFFGVAVSLLFVAASLWLFLNRQFVQDQITVMRYQPDTATVVAADRAGLNSNGKFLLYASVPQMQDRDTFRNSCSSRGEETAVLGCYSAQRIYVLDVTDERLDGIEEVTLAHEMLHAAYDRLSRADKEKVDGLLEEQYKHIGNDRLKDLLAVYAQTEPGERSNELHSILATESKSLSPDLEEYYKRYFADRQKVATLFSQYYAVFDEIKTQQKELVADLNARAKSINDQITQYNIDTDALSRDIDAFNRNADSYTSQAAFNRDRQALIARQAAISRARDSISSEIAMYESKKRQLDELNLQAAKLNQSINTNIDETPSL